MAYRFLYLARHGDAGADGELTDAGRRQAALLAQRLKHVPFSAIHHSPLPRAAATAALVSEALPGVAVTADEIVGDYVPYVPEPGTLPKPYADFIDAFGADDLADGPPLARAALERFTQPTKDDTYELVVTHNFLVAWFVSQALDAPPARWMGLNQANCGLTVILYRPDRPPSLIVFNDMNHLTVDLRWTGFPEELTV
ncbi:histidine phosphatase family protein [Fodinicola acaciae]|uniref:histidine phosphatase family protein n=1 Tax=Fodinicola acaciae TaxID=2681555 RepID=UPI0013D6E27D|nr:histidine phosphatase family protein [Fodinicola acaciae]